MSADGLHCPFLNRSDARCVRNFSLGRLGHAMRYCTGQYTACPTYIELLVERRARRRVAAESGRHGLASGGGHGSGERVQVTVSVQRRNGAGGPAVRFAASGAASAAPGAAPVAHPPVV
jgi:hypothetical protein